MLLETAGSSLEMLPLFVPPSSGFTGVLAFLAAMAACLLALFWGPLWMLSSLKVCRTPELTEELFCPEGKEEELGAPTGSSWS